LYTSGTNTLRVGDGGFDLAAVAHDAGVAEQPLDVALAESRDARGIESAERAAERARRIARRARDRICGTRCGTPRACAGW